MLSLSWVLLKLLWIRGRNGGKVRVSHCREGSRRSCSMRWLDLGCMHLRGFPEKVVVSEWSWGGGRKRNIDRDFWLPGWIL